MDLLEYFKSNSELVPYYETYKKTLKPYVEIKAESVNHNLSPIASKFGGKPFILKETDYPRDPKGNPLFLLAQINFEEAPALEMFPNTGLLQIFIDGVGASDAYGANFDFPTKQDYFRIIFHPEKSVDEKKALEIADSFTPTKSGDFPVVGEYKLTFTKNSEFTSLYDFRMKKMIGDWPYKKLSEPVMETLFKEASKEIHKLGGYPFFTQTDPREEGSESEEYTELLFQMTSQWSKKTEEQIMWGDVGVSNFFIKPENLKNLDFSDVLYNWDCG